MRGMKNFLVDHYMGDNHADWIDSQMDTIINLQLNKRDEETVFRVMRYFIEGRNREIEELIDIIYPKSAWTKFWEAAYDWLFPPKPVQMFDYEKSPLYKVCGQPRNHVDPA